MGTKLQKLLVFLLFVFLPSQLGYHFWPEWSFVNGIRVDYFSPTIYFTDLFILGILALWFVERPMIRLNAHKLIVVGLVLLVSGLMSQSPMLAGYKTFRLVWYFLFGVYWFRKGHNFQKEFIWGLSIALVYTSFLAVFQFINQSSVGGMWYWLGERAYSVSTPGIAKTFVAPFGMLVRSYATFPHPNLLAAFLVTTSALLISVNKKLTQWFWFIPAMALVVAGSRFGMAATLLLLAVVVWGKTRKEYKRGITGVILTLAILALFFPGNPESFAERAVLNQRAVRLAAENLPFGVGFGNFVLASSKLDGIIKTNLVLQPVHNVFLLVLAELGIVGLLVFIKGFAMWAKATLRSRNLYLIGLLVIVVGWGMIDHFWLTLHQGTLLLAVIISQTALQSKSKNL